MLLDAKQQASQALVQSGIFQPVSEAIDSPTTQIWIDGSIFALSFALAYLIRFDGPPGRADTMQLFAWLPVLVGARLLANWKTGVYRFIWRFVCLSDAIAIGRSLLMVTAGLLALRLVYPHDAAFSYWLRLPLGIIALEFLLSLPISLGVRAASRVLHERSERSRLGPGQSLRRVLLYGAGRAGILLRRELFSHPDIEVVGFVDDNPQKVGTVISGVTVLGTGHTLREIAQRYRVDEIIISIATASPGALARIMAACKRIPLTPKIIPTLQEILSREVSISHVRDVRIEDLLGRGPVNVEELDDHVRETYRGKKVLVTGAGGSIGSELTRQLLFLEPKKIFILDKDENSIYELEHELKFLNPKIAVESVIADVRFRERIFSVWAEAMPEVVFHAAAHKHVPLMEKHPCEAVLNNVMGTKNVLEACRVFGTSRFIFISSDKAVNPTNVMGATKRVGEKLVSAYGKGGQLRGACVRFGNVMGSRGSVIPLFQKQIETGGPVTVTHPDIVRFFMTIPEAVQLVLCAGSLSEQGDVFVLDMGSPRRIYDLARQMIVLSGLEPEKDIRIAITGLRPGEKMNEELLAPGESANPTRFDKISVIQHAPSDVHAFRECLSSVLRAAHRNDRHAVYEVLSAMGLGFTPTPPLYEKPQDADYVTIPS